MKKVGFFVENVSDKAVKVMIMLVSGLLAYWATRYTWLYPSDYSAERVYIVPDSLWKNLLTVILVVALLYGLQALVLRGTEEQRRKKVFVFSLIVLAVAGLMLCLFVTNTHIPPYWDQAQVYLDALDFKAGNFGDMDGYLAMYPQQYGLIFLYEMVFLVTKDSYVVLEYLNVLFVLFILFFSYRISEELFHNQTVNFYCILGGALFLPMHIYVNFVYGDLPSTAFSTIGLWAVLCWKRSDKMRYAGVAVISFVVAYLSRKNILIVLIAVLITLIIDAFSHRNWKSLVLGLLIFSLPMAAMSGVKLSYEWRSGKEAAEGIPAIMWVAMGMQGDDLNCGMFNGYTESYFRGAAGSDPEVAAQIAKEEIRNRWEVFQADRDRAVDFYKSKIQLQWNEPTFSSLFMTSKFGEAPTPYTLEFYYGKAPERMICIMNDYLTTLYIGVFCYALTSLRKKEAILQSMIGVAIIGGFLFSILWEAKGRYVMPYAVLMIPYMAQGIHKMQIIVRDNGKKILKKVAKNET